MVLLPPDISSSNSQDSSYVLHVFIDEFRKILHGHPTVVRVHPTHRPKHSIPGDCPAAQHDEVHARVLSEMHMWHRISEIYVPDALMFRDSPSNFARQARENHSETLNYIQHVPLTIRAWLTFLPLLWRFSTGGQRTALVFRVECRNAPVVFLFRTQIV